MLWHSYTTRMLYIKGQNIKLFLLVISLCSFGALFLCWDHIFISNFFICLNYQCSNYKWTADPFLMYDVINEWSFLKCLENFKFQMNIVNTLPSTWYTCGLSQSCPWPPSSSFTTCTRPFSLSPCTSFTQFLSPSSWSGSWGCKSIFIIKK